MSYLKKDDYSKSDYRTCKFCNNSVIPVLHTGGYYCPICNRLLLEYNREEPIYKGRTPDNDIY